MMEENNRKGPGVFYAVMGVATLVVAIIGATFAFFSATTDADTTIGGETAEVSSLQLKVEPVVQPEDKGLVPLNEAAVLNAVKGGCVDSNENAACHVYRITITNPGSAAVESRGQLTLAAATGAENKFTNLKWALVQGLDDAATDATGATGVGSTNGMALTDIGTPTLSPAGTANATEVYYVVVWVNNLTSDQTADDIGSFVGTVTWAGIDGEVKVQSTFTA